MPDTTIERNALRAGDVLLYHRTSAIGRLIRFFDGSDVSHAALYIDPNVAESIGKGLLKQTLEDSLGPEPGDCRGARWNTHLRFALTAGLRFSAHSNDNTTTLEGGISNES